MLVDLGRNDLGKISKFGTVQVENCILLNDSPMLCTLALLYGVK